MAVVAAILAAGRGSRFGVDKARMRLRGKPIWRYSYETFLSHPSIDAVGVVCPTESLAEYRDLAPDAAFIASGGESRQESARAAVVAGAGAEILLLHDAARPFVSAEVIGRVVEGVLRSGAAAPAIPVADTIRMRMREPSELAVVDRDTLIAMQTPQGARLDLLQSAHAQATEIFTDEVALLQNAGIATEIVEGDKRNIKITTPEDLSLAKSLLGEPERRTGFGYDIHPFSKDVNRKLYLGGLLFEDAPGLEGHSDADVLIHAIVDSLLGAASLGDIGMHFPNSDPQWRNRESLFFLQETGHMLEAGGWRIVNVDATIVAEFPKIMHYAEAMRRRLSECLGIGADRISIKATTNEKLGAIGRGEGVAAMAVATISESD